MIKSATDRQAETAHHISACSQLLADEHGFDGFTMEQLAEAAGVSRRTLFNYFPRKADAVLGESSGVRSQQLEEFLSGGPHHDLVKDLGVLADGMLRAKIIDRDSVARYRRLLSNNPKLMAAAHQRLEAMSQLLVDAILEREGPAFDAHRARVAIKVLMALFDASLDTFVTEESDRELADVFADSLTVAHELLS